MNKPLTPKKFSRGITNNRVVIQLTLKTYDSLGNDLDLQFLATTANTIRSHDYVKFLISSAHTSTGGGKMAPRAFEQGKVIVFVYRNDIEPISLPIISPVRFIIETPNYAMVDFERAPVKFIRDSFLTKNSLTLRLQQWPEEVRLFPRKTAKLLSLVPNLEDIFEEHDKYTNTLTLTLTGSFVKNNVKVEHSKNNDLVRLVVPVMLSEPQRSLAVFVNKKYLDRESDFLIPPIHYILWPDIDLRKEAASFRAMFSTPMTEVHYSLLEKLSGLDLSVKFVGWNSDQPVLFSGATECCLLYMSDDGKWLKFEFLDIVPQSKETIKFLVLTEEIEKASPIATTTDKNVISLVVSPQNYLVYHRNCFTELKEREDVEVELTLQKLKKWNESYPEIRASVSGDDVIIKFSTKDAKVCTDNMCQVKIIIESSMTKQKLVIMLPLSYKNKAAVPPQSYIYCPPKDYFHPLNHEAILFDAHNRWDKKRKETMSMTNIFKGVLTLNSSFKQETPKTSKKETLTPYEQKMYDMFKAAMCEQ